MTDTSNNTPSLCWEKDQQINLPKNVSFLSCSIDHSLEPDCLYNSLTFWSFVLLMCFGTIGFNVTNCISDAICFDMLGESQEMKYGAQRVWGTIGFGASALIAGFLTDIMTTDVVKSITPAIIVMIIASGLDLFSVAKLKVITYNTNLRQINIFIPQLLHFSFRNCLQLTRYFAKCGPFCASHESPFFCCLPQLRELSIPS